MRLAATTQLLRRKWSRLRVGRRGKDARTRAQSFGPARVMDTLDGTIRAYVANIEHREMLSFPFQNTLKPPTGFVIVIELSLTCRAVSVQFLNIIFFTWFNIHNLFVASASLSSCC